MHKKQFTKNRETQRLHPITMLALLGCFSVLLVYFSSLTSAIGLSTSQTSNDLPSLPPIIQGQCTQLIQTCANCTYVNLTTITHFPDATITSVNAQMSKLDSSDYNYTYCNTTELGTLVYNTLGDPNGILVNQQVSREITPTGNSSNIWYFVLVTGLFYFLAIFGFTKRNGVMAALGGIGMIVLGIYFVNGGLDIYRDTVTLTLSYITLGLGSYFFLAPTLDTLVEAFNDLK